MLQRSSAEPTPKPVPMTNPRPIFFARVPSSNSLHPTEPQTNASGHPAAAHRLGGGSAGRSCQRRRAARSLALRGSTSARSDHNACAPPSSLELAVEEAGVDHELHLVFHVDRHLPLGDGAWQRAEHVARRLHDDNDDGLDGARARRGQGRAVDVGHGCDWSHVLAHVRVALPARHLDRVRIGVVAGGAGGVEQDCRAVPVSDALHLCWLGLARDVLVHWREPRVEVRMPSAEQYKQAPERQGDVRADEEAASGTSGLRPCTSHGD
eukprot:CAMPEP_0204140948 /NCGR_PEP_ID=MMETSP0361-20130328/19235_1 /ASSEMBLY_ACC=CAM_ASM_000343 /TAXON_ID=268821 /ORGANISM="Scrippsiella Hangoei, Strain SHTV-5" /LENGTH=265 /DNA_ID=CAMNT_0051094763 /DNA_START=399 /DNA_END=1198 /DNA_ORIENTATION=-